MVVCLRGCIWRPLLSHASVTPRSPPFERRTARTLVDERPRANVNFVPVDTWPCLGVENSTVLVDVAGEEVGLAVGYPECLYVTPTWLGL